ncbi:hypothetical protein ScPMuIL_015963 [Solemya velum]
MQRKRKRGRPRNSWRRDTEAEMELRGTNWNGIARAAHNRVRWRGVVDGLCSTLKQIDLHNCHYAAHHNSDIRTKNEVGDDDVGNNQPSTCQTPALKERLAHLADTTTLHGVPRIVSSTRWYRKLIWLILVLTVVCYLIVQLTDLYKVFMKNPIKTSIRMKYQPTMSFPAVTLCNVNPIRKSKLKDFENALSNYTGESYPAEIYNGTMDHGDDYYDYYDEDFEDVHSEYQSEELKLMKPKPFDKWHTLQRQLIFNMSKMSWSQRDSVGHQYENLIVGCTVAGRECIGDVGVMSTSTYGNCFTLESPTYKTKASGPLFGISVTLNLENFEFIDDFRRGNGARLVIHQPGTMPMPDQEGITLSAGYETTISLNKIRKRRLGPPHGVCDDAKEFKTKYKMQYTRQICQFVREKIDIHKNCLCDLRDVYLPLLYATTHLGKATACYSNSTLNDCAQTWKYMASQNPYQCANPCRETVYDQSFSGRLWPTDSYLSTLKDQVCQEQYADPNCTGNDCGPCPLDAFDNQTLRMNFAKVIIYYNDLNLQYIEEEPLYGTTRFLSDVGGTMGLYIGASVLSLCEVIDVVFEMVTWAAKCILRKK